MKIAIIGAGAMGSLFGGRLALAGEEVWLLDVWEEHVRAINDKGLAIAAADRDIVARPKATTRLEDIGTAELVIVFVKSTATAKAAETALSLLGPDTAVLTLQNGYGNAEAIAAAVGAGRVIAGTTAQGATLLGPGRIMHGGSGETHIGELGGGLTARLEKIAACLTRAGIQTVADDNVASLIWGKLIVNVGINALTGITGLKNGELAEHDETRQVLALAVEEAVRVADAAGVKLPYGDPVEKVLAVAVATAQNRSSMLQDLSGGRMTEIEAINGALVREGERYGVATPVNRVLTLLIKALEKLPRENRP
ncbi:ketopantoate reductase family protein [Anaeroselena agilis]|uniref:2-dehydropantoate 2-reductase n=1 Tax=Anaeroselena agilis TaxID=3063788 RepID=A0ABU3P399_9FIRM|nr:2-dehydropantoate 2-reductase [Selenomonadales bacterium 4137-cl]